jgi:hypothetical protein
MNVFGLSESEVVVMDSVSAKCDVVMRGLDPRIHLLAKMDGLPGQARQ